MPMYEYQCGACGHRLEAIQKFSDKPLKACPKCKKAKLERLLSSPAIQFKGSGWYITDYARKSSGEAPTAKVDGNGSGSEAKADAGSDASKGAAAATKEAAKPATKSDASKGASSSKK